MTRARIAAGGYWLAGVLFALAFVLGLFGGVELGPLRVGSWRILRVIVGVAVGAALVDPDLGGTLARLEERLGRLRWLLPALAAAAVGYAVLFKVAQHASFRTTAYDLSMFHHALENTLRGRFLHAFGIERSFLSEHASPVLLLLLPLYAVFRSPYFLVVVQGACAALAVVPLYALSRREGASRVVALGLGVAFCFNAFLWRGIAFDFHPEVMAPLGLLTAAWAFRAGRWLPFYAAVAFTLSLKEELGFVMAAAAVYWAVTDRTQRRHAAIAAALGVGWAVAAFTAIIPLSYPVAAERSHFIERYRHLGSTYWEVALAFLSRPGYVLSLLVGPPARAFLLSTGGVALLSPLAVLLAAPLLVLHLASGDEDQATLVLYYAVPALGLVFVGLAEALPRFALRRGQPLALGLLALALVAQPFAPFLDRITERDRMGHLWLSQLPEGAAISAQNGVLPHLPVSGSLRLFPEVGQSEWIVLDLARSTWPLEPPDYRARVLELLADGKVGVTQYDGRFVLLRRGASRAVNDVVARDVASRELGR